MHDCKHEDELMELKHAVFGNGKTGLVENYIRTDENIKKLTETSTNLTTAVNGLLRFMNETKGERGSKVTINWLIGLLITVLLGFGGLIIAMLK